MGIYTQGHLFLEKIVFVILVNFFMKMKIFCPCYDQCRIQYCDKFNAQCYIKENPIIDNINTSNIKITRRVCKFLKNCFDINKAKLQHN